VDGIGVFPSVIYGKVGIGAEQIRRMNAVLVERLGDRVVRSQYDCQNMMPHVSIAHFTAQDVKPLIATTKKFANSFIGKMNVREIHIKKWYPHRLFDIPRSRASVSKPLAKFDLGLGTPG
jgi:2'-5' RNA ligase